MKLFCKKCQKVFEAEKPLDSEVVKCPVCGEGQPYPKAVPGPGVVLGDFLIEKLLSRGGMGEVFLAKQISLDRPVALKVLQQKYLNDREYVDSLYREARAAAKLNHPNIVQAYAVGEDDGIFYFAMEFIRGETFKQILNREKTIGFVRAAKVIRDVARALDAAWREQKLVHQDIKPDNIMLDANGFAKLADLGLAKVATGADDSSDDGDEVLGTPQYISPEQLTGVPTDIRSDIYSLGATFYHFVTGRFPYVADSSDAIARMHVEGKLQPPKEVNPALPEALNKIIMKMMARDINERYQGAEPLIRALDMYLRSAPAGGGAVAPKLSMKGQVLATPPTLPKIQKPGTSPAVPAPPASTASDKVPKEPEPDGGDDEIEDDGKKRRRLILIGGIAAGAVLLLVVIAVVVLVLGHKQDNLPKSLKPTGRYLAGIFGGAGGGHKPAPAPRPPKKPATPPPPPAAVIKTRPEYIAEIVNIIRIYDVSPDNAGKFLVAADAFFAAGKLPRTPQERNEYARLRSIFAPQDEKLRFEPFRRNARKMHLEALAKVERDRERERLARERQEREEAERRAREEARIEAERRRIQQERRRQEEIRINKLRSDMREVLLKLVSGFYAALDGDQSRFTAACDAASAFLIPSESKTPKELRLINEFNAFRNELPAELKNVQAFRRSVTDMPEGFSYPAPRVGVVQVVSLLPDGGIVYRGSDGSRATLPKLDAAARRRLIMVLTKYTGNPKSALYYAIMTKQFDREVLKSAPSGFWRNYAGQFAELIGLVK